jgi:hypothetical protein
MTKNRGLWGLINIAQLGEQSGRGYTGIRMMFENRMKNFGRGTKNWVENSVKILKTERLIIKILEIWKK